MLLGDNGCFTEPVVNILVVIRKFLKDQLMAYIQCSVICLHVFQVLTVVHTYSLGQLSRGISNPFHSQVHHL